MVALASSTTEFLLVVLAAWLAIGSTLAVVMGRRGHGAFQWFVIGAILGPLSLPIAWRAVRDETTVAARPLGEGIAGGGTVDVLVGLDGSEQSARALRTVVEVVGTNLGRLTLASVATYDDSTQARRDEEAAAELLEAAAGSLPRLTPGRVLLSGQPADALIRHAIDERYDLLAIGRRGRGASKALLGSTASRAANGPIPVLIV